MTLIGKDAPVTRNNFASIELYIVPVVWKVPNHQTPVPTTKILVKYTNRENVALESSIFDSNYLNQHYSETISLR